MDKNKALDQLESVRPDSDDLMDPKFHEAAALVQTDADLEAVFHQRQNNDRKIANAMQDVEVPAGLKERLLASVDAAAGTSSTTTAPANTSPLRRVSRRTWLTTAAAIALCVVAGVMLWPSTPLTLQIVEDELIPWQDDTISKLPELEESSLVSPTGAQLAAKGVTGRKWKQATVYSFTFENTQCGLIVAPDKLCTNNLKGAATVAIKAGYAMVSWKSGSLRCVLLVENADKFEQVRSRLEQLTT